MVVVAELVSSVLGVVDVVVASSSVVSRRTVLRLLVVLVFSRDVVAIVVLRASDDVDDAEVFSEVSSRLIVPVLLAAVSAEEVVTGVEVSISAIS